MAFLFEKEPMVFFVVEMVAHEACHKVECLFDFGVVQPGDEGFEQFIVGELLQGGHERLFVDVAGEAESDHPVEVVDEIVPVWDRNPGFRIGITHYFSPVESRSESG